MERKQMHFITYEMFGAIGDGIADDMPAIVAAHEKANKLGLPVCAKAGAVYYIGPADRTAEVQTSVDWTGARFLIDDVNCENKRSVVFEIRSAQKTVEFALESLKRGQTHIPNPYKKDLYLIVKNDKHRDYIRRGVNQDKGAARIDNFIVRWDGTLPSPVSFDFKEVTEVTALPIDEELLVLKGGEFVTIANQDSYPYEYHLRGIRVKRSQVEISGITHLVTGELEHGSPYAGFLNVSECAQVYVHDCIFTGHKIYNFQMKNGQWNCMGTYDINLGNASSVTLARCTQTNDIMDRDYWGIIGTFFCRDLLLEDCKFSRYDAHQGVTNCTLRRCTLGWQCLNTIGHGTFLIEEVEAYGNAFVHLRGDYGSTWNGDIIVKNSTWHPMGENRAIFTADNDGTHDFGYDCHLPHRIYIDGLTIVERFEAEVDINGKSTVSGGAKDLSPLYILNDFRGDSQIPEEDRKYAPTEPVSVTVKNLHSERFLKLCANSELMQNTEFKI